MFSTMQHTPLDTRASQRSTLVVFACLRNVSIKQPLHSERATQLTTTKSNDCNSQLLTRPSVCLRNASRSARVRVGSVVASSTVEATAACRPACCCAATANRASQALRSSNLASSSFKRRRSCARTVFNEVCCTSVSSYRGSCSSNGCTATTHNSTIACSCSNACWACSEQQQLVARSQISVQGSTEESELTHFSKSCNTTTNTAAQTGCIHECTHT
jgi:hypothetical protein